MLVYSKLLSVSLSSERDLGTPSAPCVNFNVFNDGADQPTCAQSKAAFEGSLSCAQQWDDSTNYQYSYTTRDRHFQFLVFYPTQLKPRRGPSDVSRDVKTIYRKK
jgi:hypothetical protein